jgi:hypothetical protein
VLLPSMPYQSVRQKALASARQTVHAASSLLVLRYLASRAINVQDSTFACYHYAKSRVKRIINTRYVAERKCRKSPLMNIFEDDLREDEDGNHFGCLI